QAETTQAGTITEFRQLIEYPPISEEDQIKLKGTLKQYREWEAAQLQKMRNAGKKEDPKAKAKKDKAKEKAKEKGKKGKKGKKEEEVVEEAKEIPPEPAFAQGLKLDPFEHCVKVLQGRLGEQPSPEAAELLSRALAVLAVADREGAVELEAVPLEMPQGATEEAEEEAQAADCARKPEDSMQDQENIAPQAPKSAWTSVKKGKKRLSVVETEWSFSYFKSETGLQFLMDTGMLDPDSKPRQAVVKEKRPRPAPPPPPRTPWNPRLVGEPTDEPEQEASPENRGAEDEEVEDGWPGATFGVPEFGALAEDENQQQFFQPAQRVPIMAVQDDAPFGPHPDKKGPTWDVYGEPRAPKGKISQAYVGVNTDYMEVEGPTGRRTNTSALAHKRSHVKGLGDNHMLVEVMPGACRFGPLRQGSLYRMSVFVRNLEVDVTRFNVKPPESKLVNVKWQPGHLAPGMATKLTVEVLALEPARIEQLLEVHTKAHIIRVPITARIVGAEEYDRLDAESMALHGRRIGRHREKSETHKPGPVQLITEPSYCKKVMGPTWQPPPVEFDDLPATELLR
ncbi:SPAG17, partial [Symbiodinium pilosum]